MIKHFLNLDSAIESIQKQTMQKCNEFTLLHYITNGYLKLYFKYTGYLYEKSYNNFSVYDFDKEDFTILSTASLQDTFLEINLEGIDYSQLFKVFHNQTDTLNVHEVFMGESPNIYHLAKECVHSKHSPSSKADIISLYKFLDEELPFRSYELSNSKDIDLSQINTSTQLNSENIYFCSDEIDGLKSPSSNKRSVNTYNRNNLSLENKLLIQYFYEKLDEVNKDHRHLFLDDKATIIEKTMKAINRPIEWSTIRKYLKDPSRLIKERTV